MEKIRSTPGDSMSLDSYLENAKKDLKANRDRWVGKAVGTAEEKKKVLSAIKDDIQKIVNHYFEKIREEYIKEVTLGDLDES